MPPHSLLLTPPTQVARPQGALEALEAINVAGLPAKTRAAIQALKTSILLWNKLRQSHHYLPKQYKKWFESKGINIEDYTLKINAYLHRLIHGNVKYGPWLRQLYTDWNSRWEQFIRDNPNATQKQIIDFMNKLADEFHLPRPGGG